MTCKIKEITRSSGRFCLILAALAVISADVQAKSRKVDDKLIAGARQCTQHFARQERKHGIPVHLLAAIASTESGRWSDKLGMVVPWPWTINVEGKGYYFDSKSEALAKVRDYQAQGKRSIDIGCMQVNLRHHPDAFSSLSDAFDPASNVAYAAKFLRRNYDDSRSWVKATAAYHSKTPKFGNKYLARIEKNWNKIVGKIRTARVQSGQTGRRYAVKVGDKKSEVAPVQMASLRTELARASSPKKTLPLRNVDRLGARKKASESRVKLNSISLSSGSDKLDQTLIIKPKVMNRQVAEISATLQTDKALESQASSLFRPTSNFLIQPEQERRLKKAQREAADKQAEKAEQKKSSTRKVVFVE